MLDISFEQSPENHPNAICILLTGRLDSAGAATFEASWTDLPLEAGTVLLDVGELEYISSAGLRVLLQLHKKLGKQKRRLVICRPTPFVTQVIELSGMTAIFTTAPDTRQALQGAGARAPLTWTRDTEQAEIHFSLLSQAGNFMELWEDPAKDGLFQASLAELGICMGFGGFGSRREHALDNMGLFFASHTVAALLPDGAPELPDFLTTRYPSETVMFVARGASISGDPDACFSIQAKDSLSLGRLLRELHADQKKAGLLDEADNATISVVQLFADDLKPSAQDAAPAPGAMILCFYYFGGSAEKSPNPLPFLPWRRDGDLFCCALALTLNVAPNVSSHGKLSQNVEQLCTLEHIHSFCEIGPEATMHRGAGWAWPHPTQRSASEKRLRIETPGENWPETWDVIVRRIFANPTMESPESASSRVVLTPLHGGYSSTNFIAESFDLHNRRQLPTVLKLGGAALINRELQAYRQHVQPFILNNATSVIGHATHDDQAGLRYNLLGIGGHDTKLSWLADHYLNRPAAQVVPLFDRIVTSILKPWYGQPCLDIVRPWREHDPTQRFPNILEAAEQELGLGADAPVFDCPELGRPLRNPFHVLAHEFPKRAHETMHWYTSVVHGDLNMQNVLLDERENIYIIDFSETRRGNAVGDFARLEPILLVEHARLNSDADCDTLALFMETWYATPTLAAVPPFGYAGSDARISKAYQILRRLRSYAGTVTLFETDIRPYLLAVLQWALPVVCFRDYEPRRKRMGAIMAGILCEQILEPIVTADAI